MIYWSKTVRNDVSGSGGGAGLVGLLTLTFVLSPLRLEIWNNTPSKSATVTSIDSGLVLQENNWIKLNDCCLIMIIRLSENSHDNKDGVEWLPGWCVIKMLIEPLRVFEGEPGEVRWFIHRWSRVAMSHACNFTHDVNFYCIANFFEARKNRRKFENSQKASLVSAIVIW